MSPAATEEHAREEKPNGGFIQRLQEYKELLALVAFFLSGFVWIQNQYPTKSDLKAQIGELSCLVGKYMVLTQLQYSAQNLDGDARQLREEIAAFGDDPAHAQPPLSPAMERELESKKAVLAAKQDESKTTAASIQTTRDELARNICGKAQ